MEEHQTVENSNGKIDAVLETPEEDTSSAESEENKESETTTELKDLEERDMPKPSEDTSVDKFDS